MKRIALVIILAVFVPSLVLAWLATRSLRDQRLILERQQYLLYQGVADSLAQNAGNVLNTQQHEFGRQVEKLIASRQPSEVATNFDRQLRADWPLAEIGFVVTTGGSMLSPTDMRIPACRDFYVENGKFLCNVQPAEVYWNNSTANGSNLKKELTTNDAPGVSSSSYSNSREGSKNYAQTKVAQNFRNVFVEQPAAITQADNSSQQLSKISSSEAEFRELVGDSNEGSIARFLENKLNLIFWYRSVRDPHLIFGAKLALSQLKQQLAPVVQDIEPGLADDIFVALLDDTAKPVAVSRQGFHADWKHPFVATELSEALPHWEMAVYLVNPGKLAESARLLNLTLGLLIVVLLFAIGIGGWLIYSDLNRHLTLARQKTDFVSNVSHELKTPLTSIRMFSELLADGRVVDAQKRQSYLNIITAETARLTRLINNVLDFSRMERGEKKYNFAQCDLVELVRETVETFRPHLESSGFVFSCQLPQAPVIVNCDRDALAQVVVNLLSNAEKYSNDRKEIEVQAEALREPLPYAEIRVLDRGTGVPRGCEQKIFEKFYRAHDSLASGIQGSGLGLTLARQIARAHGGDVILHHRDGGGSIFTLRIPTAVETV